MNEIKKFMLIDDDMDDAGLFKDALQEVAPSATFEYFPDGKEAINLLLQSGIALPDFIFLDINMPTVSGWQCLSEIKKTSYLSGIPVIMYTTSSSIREKEIARDLGAAGLITKPDSFKKLKAVISAIFFAPAEKLHFALKEI